jgi:hypothetical protein
MHVALPPRPIYGFKSLSLGTMVTIIAVIIIIIIIIIIIKCKKGTAVPVLN